MKTRILACLFASLAMALAWENVEAQHLQRHHSGIVCEPGFQIVEETVLQDVERVVCKTVTVPKKKWVYDWVPDPFCVLDCKHGLGLGHGQCAQCAQCAGPYCRKLLVKREVDDPCFTVTVCVAEKIVERVPVTVYRKVPCAPGTPGAVTPAPKGEPIPIRPMPLPK